MPSGAGSCGPRAASRAERRTGAPEAVLEPGDHRSRAARRYRSAPARGGGAPDTLLPGATGAIGSAPAVRLHRGGARLAPAGRDREALHRVSVACGARPVSGSTPTTWTVVPSPRAGRPTRSAASTRWSSVRVWPASDGRSSVPDAVAEHLFTVDALAPLAVLRAALGRVPRPGVLAAVTSDVVDAPPAGMADYAAAKAASAAWLVAVRREQRRTGVTVLDIRLPHVESRFAARGRGGPAPGAARPDGRRGRGPDSHCTRHRVSRRGTPGP
ncbi:SDR family NAD(P)-dependent oxidoreductase [Streptomyces sp. NPDC001450]